MAFVSASGVDKAFAEVKLVLNYVRGHSLPLLGFSFEEFHHLGQLFFNFVIC